MADFKDSMAEDSLSTMMALSISGSPQ